MISNPVYGRSFPPIFQDFGHNIHIIILYIYIYIYLDLPSLSVTPPRHSQAGQKRARESQKVEPLSKRQKEVHQMMSALRISMRCPKISPNPQVNHTFSQCSI